MTQPKTTSDLWLEHGVDFAARRLYLGSHAACDDDTGETGVDWQMARMAIPALLKMDDDPSHRPIQITMNTPGGDWSHGMAIYDCIRGLESPVTIVGHGCVRSMSSLIFQAADLRILSAHCDLMIHDGHDAVSDIPRSVEAWAEHSRSVIRPTMYRIYSERAALAGKELPVETVRQWCARDTIFTAAQAVAVGLADEVLDD